MEEEDGLVRMSPRRTQMEEPFRSQQIEFLGSEEQRGDASFEEFFSAKFPEKTKAPPCQEDEREGKAEDRCALTKSFWEVGLGLDSDEARNEEAAGGEEEDEEETDNVAIPSPSALLHLLGLLKPPPFRRSPDSVLKARRRLIGRIEENGRINV